MRFAWGKTPTTVISVPVLNYFMDTKYQRYACSIRSARVNGLILSPTIGSCSEETQEVLCSLGNALEIPIETGRALTRLVTYFL